MTKLIGMLLKFARSVKRARAQLNLENTPQTYEIFVDRTNEQNVVTS